MNKQSKKEEYQLICQRCSHTLSEHPANHQGDRPCSKEMQFTGMSVFCYCDKFDGIGKTQPYIVKTTEL